MKLKDRPMPQPEVLEAEEVLVQEQEVLVVLVEPQEERAAVLEVPQGLREVAQVLLVVPEEQGDQEGLEVPVDPEQVALVVVEVVVQAVEAITLVVRSFPFLTPESVVQ